MVSTTNERRGTLVAMSSARIISNTFSRLTRSVVPSGATTRGRFHRYAVVNFGSNFHSRSQMNRHGRSWADAILDANITATRNSSVRPEDGHSVIATASPYLNGNSFTVWHVPHAPV